MFNIVIAIIIIVIVSMFSLQNADPVSISFFVWKFQASLAIVMFLCLLGGFIVGMALTFLFRFQRQRTSKHIDSGASQYKTKQKI